MKILKAEFRQIVKEELVTALREGYHHGASDSWEVSINVDYDKDKIVTWNIASKTSSGADSVLSGDSDRLRLDTLEKGVQKIIEDYGLDVDQADDLKNAYFEAEESFRRERA